MRCGLGLGVTVLSVILLLIALSPGIDVALCKCKNDDDDGDGAGYAHPLCIPFGASLSDLAKQGDDVVLFVYWVLVITVAILCLRVAALITFFHSENAEQYFTIDIVVNIVCCVMMLSASAIMVSWAGHSDRCSAVYFSDNSSAAIPLIVTSAAASGLVAMVDAVTVLIPANIWYYSPVLSMTQDGGHSHIDLSALPPRSARASRRGGEGEEVIADTTAAATNGPLEAAAKSQGIYTIDDEGVDDTNVNHKTGGGGAI